jgi:hypothetical protein
MMAPEEGKRRRFRRRKRSRSRLDVLTERTRQEARALSRKRRIEARRALRAETPKADVGVRLRGLGYETRRRLRPVFAPVAAILSRVAPYITRSILFVIQLIAALIALILEVAQLVIVRVKTLIGVLALTVAGWMRRHVTPPVTVAVVGAGAAILLGASQFADYHGVAVDAPAYSGEIGRVAPAPMTGQETAGSAHVWILLPVAAAALVMVWAAYRARRRFAAGVVICGVVGLAVALAVDLPQGLETGRPGLAFTGAEAKLLGGFWVEVFASATLILCGCLLPLYSRGMSPGSRRRDDGRERSRRSRASHQEIGGISPGLQAES